MFVGVRLMATRANKALKSTPSKSVPRAPAKRLKGHVFNKRWTAEEQKIVLEGFGSGKKTYKELAGQLNRTLRSIMSCWDRYKNVRGSKVKLGSWTAEEDRILIQAYERFGNESIALSDYVTGRSGRQCTERLKRLVARVSTRARGAWSAKELELLAEASDKFGTDWSAVAEHVGTRDTNQCYQKYTTLSENRGRALHSVATAEELDKLKKLVLEERRKDESFSWSTIAKNMDSGLSNNQCRAIWVSQLDPDYNHRKWSSEERKVLIDVLGQFPHFDYEETVFQVQQRLPDRNRHSISKAIVWLKSRPATYPCIHCFNVYLPNFNLLVIEWIFV